MDSSGLTFSPVYDDLSEIIRQTHVLFDDSEDGVSNPGNLYASNFYLGLRQGATAAAVAAPVSPGGIFLQHASPHEAMRPDVPYSAAAAINGVTMVPAAVATHGVIGGPTPAPPLTKSPVGPQNGWQQLLMPMPTSLQTFEAHTTASAQMDGVAPPVARQQQGAAEPRGDEDQGNEPGASREPPRSSEGSIHPDVVTEVFDPEFKFIYEVPTHCVVHLPPARLNITRLVLCRNYRPYHSSSCAMGHNCKFVHSDCDCSTLQSHPIHVNYIWRHEDLCTYPRLPAGDVLKVLQVSGDVMEAPSARILITKGVMELREFTGPLPQCTDYEGRGQCHLGQRCLGVHCVTVDPMVSGSFRRASKKMSAARADHGTTGTTLGGTAGQTSWGAGNHATATASMHSNKNPPKPLQPPQLSGPRSGTTAGLSQPGQVHGGQQHPHQPHLTLLGFPTSLFPGSPNGLRTPVQPAAATTASAGGTYGFHTAEQPHLNGVLTAYSWAPTTAVTQPIQPCAERGGGNGTPTLGGATKLHPSPQQHHHNPAFVPTALVGSASSNATKAASGFINLRNTNTGRATGTTNSMPNFVITDNGNLNERLQQTILQHLMLPTSTPRPPAPPTAFAFTIAAHPQNTDILSDPHSLGTVLYLPRGSTEASVLGAVPLSAALGGLALRGAVSLPSPSGAGHHGSEGNE